MSEFPCIGCGRLMQSNHSNPRCIRCIRSGTVAGRLDLVPVVVAPVPKADWPMWAKSVALLKTQEDTGVGDTIERQLAKVGGEQFKAFAEKIGIPCGCSDRRDNFNLLYPYGTERDTIESTAPKS